MDIDAQIAYITNGYGKVQHLEEINVDTERKKMSKSILIIDTPSSCDNCSLCILMDLYRCTVNKRYCGDEQGYFTSSTMPTWCPLKKLESWRKENEIDRRG